MKKHVPSELKWNLERLAGQYNKDRKNSFKYMKARRYKKHLTFLGDYQMGLTIEVKEQSAIELIKTLLIT